MMRGIFNAIQKNIERESELLFYLCLFGGNVGSLWGRDCFLEDNTGQLHPAYFHEPKTQEATRLGALHRL